MNDQTIEPDIAEAVHHVAYRFGISGLETLIALAQGELEEARRAYAELGSESED